MFQFMYAIPLIRINLTCNLLQRDIKEKNTF